MNCTETETTQTHSLFVGTYTDGDSDGIYRLQFNTTTGQLSEKKLMVQMQNPSFVQLSPDNKYLYAVEETADYNVNGGAVSAFAVGDSTLQLLNTQGTGGAHPCHVAVSPDGKELAVSNYTGGNLALFQIDATGKLKEGKQLIDHKGIDSTKTAHVHMAKFIENSVFTADLGLDAVKNYVKKEGAYVLDSISSLALATEAGPRHFEFSANEKFLYVINELNSTISTFEKNSEGVYKEQAIVSTLATDYSGESFCADIHLSPDGNFLYGSNRGENTIVVFKVDQTTGQLSVLERAEVHGDWPRNFTIDPSGKYLLVANQKSNNISVFKRDANLGSLTFLNDFKLGAPVCLEFMK